MGEETVRLVEPCEELRGEFLEMAGEWRAAGDARYDDALADFDAYLRDLRDHSRGLNLPPGRVPYTMFWVVAGGRVVGRSSLRHYLNPFLEREGGHVGYDVRPTERRKGYGTLILGLMLGRARAFGLTRVLVTCDRDNVASARVIERNGGVFDSGTVSEKTGKPMSRYWIEL